MLSLLTIIAIGFFLGMRHATDPDHVIAVSTIVTREHSVKRSALIGAAWGVGHTLTILAVGGSILLFRITLPPRVGLAMELAVAVMLIVLGLKNLRPLMRWFSDGAVETSIRASTLVVPERALACGKNERNKNSTLPKAGAQLPLLERSAFKESQLPHYHAHGDYVHAHQHPQTHNHPHDPQRNPVATMDRWFQKRSMYLLLRPLIIGVVHGLAGSAAIALLVLTTIPNFRWAMAYLAVFGIGTILGMMLITLTLGSTFAYGQRHFAGIGRHLGWAAGLISLALGLFIAWHIGFVDGLFTSHPTW